MASRSTAAGPAAVTGVEATTYVSTSGTDAPNTCTQLAPCKTITYAESLTSSGGTIHVAAGTYHQTANLTQPVSLLGAGEKKVIIEGTNIDEGAMGYYGVIGIDNTSGTAGTIAVSGMTVKDAYVTATEYADDQEPIDIANVDSQAGDTVSVTNVEFGPVQNPASYSGSGYYSLNAVSTNNVDMDYATGLYTAFFSEGSGGPTRFVKDVAFKLAGFTDTSTNPSTYYPAAAVFALADTSGSQNVTANNDAFYDYNGWGIVGEAGYNGGNCSNNVCTGGMTINTDHNYFDLLKAPAGDGVAAIQAYAGTNDSLTANFNYSSGQVVRPDMTVSVVNYGGTVSVTDSHNTIKVLH
jgi:hypothetical protein